jgi:hypothetical protein
LSSAEARDMVAAQQRAERVNFMGTGNLMIVITLRWAGQCKSGPIRICAGRREM